MAFINILDDNTIDRIAAGEVVERPLNVIKELVENSIDSGATIISVEIKDGGISFMRVTDNGSGIEKSEIKKAFLRHATSKIISAKDLLAISSLGFRGEALSSISSVSCVELITKTSDALTGIRYVIEGGKEIATEEIGAPNGTTIIVRDLFYNVPARKKFLKTAVTEGNYISDMIEKLALSHPEISFSLLSGGKTVIHTSGSGDLKEVIYRIYGKDISENLININYQNEYIKISGYIGKPVINRSTRQNEMFFVNGRSVHADVLSKAVEEGYKNFLMQHKFPFCTINLSIAPEEIDVNVHPAKLEIKITNSEAIYRIIADIISESLSQIELIPSVKLDEEKVENVATSKVPLPFESNRIEKEIKPLEVKRINLNVAENPKDINSFLKPFEHKSATATAPKNLSTGNVIKTPEVIRTNDIAQMNLFDDEFLTKEAKDEYKILGQLFKTYWLIGFKDKLFIMDQHAAHEKVGYERLVKRLKDKTVASQQLNPPIIFDMTAIELNTVNQYLEGFSALGFEIEDFGLGSIALRAVPTDLYGHSENEFFKEILDELIDNPLKGNFDVILDKLASMSCKAAIKGNTEMNEAQVRALLDELLTLDNPYNCPHGRPTIISMSKYEIDKKFKRIVN